MPIPPAFSPTGAAVSRVTLPQGGFILIELWNADGLTGLAAAPSSGLLEALVEQCRSALDRPLTHSLPGSADSGPVEVARADLAARIAGVPLWLWLGGAARPEVPTDRFDPDPAPVLAATRDADLKAVALARPADSILVHPVAVGGPPAVARIDALARTFRWSLAIAAETPLVLSRALARHLTLTTESASLPPVGPPIVSLGWLRPVDPDQVERPEAPGLGVELDRALFDPAVGARVTVGRSA